MIYSILDNDLYKFSMQAAVLSEYPTAVVEYRFANRRLTDKFNKKAYKGILKDIQRMASLVLRKKEKDWFQKTCPFLPVSYFEYLANYRFDPKEVKVKLNKDGELEIVIAGLWHRTILWEVPLLAIISENYFKYVDTKWNEDGQEELINNKGQMLSVNGCKVSDFSTRRRRSFKAQERVVRNLKNYDCFVGTSNVYLAFVYNVRPIGTMAHEWIMAHQVFGGVKHCNREALVAWNKVFQGDLGIALSDTIGTDAFFADFDPVLSRLFDGVRHDSGDPFVFANKAIAHYKSLKINPNDKSIIFSDALTVKLAVEIQKYCEGKIRCAFGIGTHFSNDYTNSRALNIVIKLYSVNGIPVVKLSDSITKAMGFMDALRVARYIVFGIPLDEPFGDKN